MGLLPTIYPSYFTQCDQLFFGSENGPLLSGREIVVCPMSRNTIEVDKIKNDVEILKGGQLAINSTPQLPSPRTKDTK